MFVICGMIPLLSKNVIEFIVHRISKYFHAHKFVYLPNMYLKCVYKNVMKKLYVDVRVCHIQYILCTCSKKCNGNYF